MLKPQPFPAFQKAKGQIETPTFLPGLSLSYSLWTSWNHLEPASHQAIDEHIKDTLAILEDKNQD